MITNALNRDKPVSVYRKITDFLDENTSDTEAIEAMFSSIGSRQRKVTYDFCGLELHLTRPVYYPKEASRYSVFYNGTLKALHSEGAILSGDKGEGLGIGWSGDDNVIRWMDTPIFYNMHFIGGNVQLELIATTQATLEDCTFNQSKVGLDGVFALQTTLSRCKFQEQTVDHCVMKTGVRDAYLMNYAETLEDGIHKEQMLERAQKVFTNASSTNSQANHTVFRDCRFLNTHNNGLNALRVLGSNNVRVENSVFEGRMPDQMIHVDYQGSTTFVSFTAEDLHIEYVDPDTTDLLFYLRGGIWNELKGIYSQTACRSIYAEPAAYGTVVIERPRYFYVTNGRLETKDPVRDNWVIIGTPNYTDWFKETTWVDGKIPANLFVQNPERLIGYGKSPFLENAKTDSRIGVHSNGRIDLGSKTQNNELATSINAILDYRQNPKEDITVFRMNAGDLGVQRKIKFDK